MAKPSRLRRLGTWIGVPLVFCGLALVLIIHDLENLKVPFLSARDASSLILIAKSAASQMVVVNRSSDRVYSPTIGYLNSQQIDSTRLRADAKLFDAWSLQLQIGREALKVTQSDSWTRSSAEFHGLAARRVDPWEHYLCLLRRGDTLVVMSGGPTAPSSPICRNIKVSEGELSSVPRGRLLETPGGNLLLVVDRKESTSAIPRS
jgi:hypothetical protein